MNKEDCVVAVTYTHARENLASLLNRAAEDRETVIITRRKGGDVALIAADELRSLEETAYLLRSPKNARRLLEALARSRAGDVQQVDLEELRTELGRGQASKAQ